MICLSSRAKRAEQELAATSSRMRFYAEESSKHLDRAHNAEDVADELREELAAAIKERDEARSQRDLNASRARSAATALAETEEKLRKAELALDLSRDRREEIGKQLDELRVAAQSCCMTMAGAADWLVKNSSSGSAASEIAVLLQLGADGTDEILNN